ncbi:MAG: ATP-binding cassette domain-containing protein, partial [Erysipelotrichales bacterium]
MLSIRNLDFSYDRKNIINDFSLDINSDEVIALIGQSGCGKSTIIKCCADILETKNAIILNEKPIDAKQNKIGLVMQDLGLFTWLNVKDNCLLPYRIKKIGVDSKVIDQLNHVTSQLNIKQLYKRQVNQLSGGQQQRVALARL